MSLEELRLKRLKWVEANRENGFDDGIRRLLTDLYPDNAHFIYELLQNAEDARATEVRFTLREDRVEFEHNGALFTLEDVDSITSIGFSTKREDHTSIGKFGVGFKAVFAYTETPEVVSGEYHFRIRDLVVPDTEELASCPRNEKQTYFSFPFDNDAKPPERARDEIERNLQELDESTLLFLSNIKKIEYRLPDSTEGFIERRATDQENRIEILVQRRLGYPEPDSVSFLRFEKEVEINDEDGAPKSCRIAIAFLLERQQEQTAKRPTKGQKRSQSVQWRIKSLEPGQVSIYFPAEKETSNLRFHLHAPFASTVARDSVRGCLENYELRNHLADLIAESMTAIRNRGLLTVGFLATLPNDQDNLSWFYKPIMDRLVEMFNNEKLVPMKQGGHAPAKDVFRGSARLSDIIEDKDLAKILGDGHSPPLWIANPPQRNQREDRFLFMLEITEWTTSKLVDELSEKFDTIIKWLKKKTYEWHRRFYVLLLDELERDESYKLRNLRIIRCSDKKYRIGTNCYFPSDGVERDESMPRVAKELYSSGKDKNQRDKAREFLEKIGVREVGEKERIEAILEDRYRSNGLKLKIKDIKRFINFVGKYPEQTDVFKHYSIFKLTDGKWGKPSEVYLDSPFYETGLSAYYEALGDDVQRWALSEDYEKCGIDPEKIGKFAKEVGARTQLCVKEQSVSWMHPENLRSYSGRRSQYETSRDYDIPEFDVLLNDSDLGKSQLIWNTMNGLSDYCLKAEYSPNASYSREGNSTLVHRLIGKNWVPQVENGKESFVKPSEAVAELLPKGFSYERAQWLEAVEFGKSRQDREEQERRRKERATQEYQRKEETAVEMGFDSAEQAEEMARQKEEFKEFIQEKKAKKQRPTFPEQTSNNPDRRRERVKDQHANAPEKEYEDRERSVRTSRGAVVPKIDLREQYTNDSGEMVCQICQEEMPFKKRDGKYYFEAVEALSKDYFPKEYEAQSIALCPLCAAMYKEFVICDEDAMKELHRVLKNSDDLEVSLNLGELETSIRFVQTHRQDMQTILQRIAPEKSK